MALAKHLGHEFNSDHIIGFITGTMDTMLAAQTAVIAAKSLGIDSMITNGLHRNSFDNVYEALKLPATSCFPLVTVVLGYPRQEPPYQKGRLDLDAVVHFGEYRPMTETQLDRIVAQYDDLSKHVGLIGNWQEQGFRHYLDWFYTKWTGKPAAERVATGKVLEFQERLAKSGFWWPTAQRPPETQSPIPRRVGLYCEAPCSCWAAVPSKPAVDCRLTSTPTPQCTSTSCGLAFGQCGEAGRRQRMWPITIGHMPSGCLRSPPFDCRGSHVVVGSHVPLRPREARQGRFGKPARAVAYAE
jgi:hypothetical protein